ncbi:MAG TPA: PQQ-binding-like beta-propeller repeat protein [Candidatus Competibacter sp.]|nr:PQQ-binding-like beta-propeller repeat protein [Candidatus Competibacter sp.]
MWRGRLWKLWKGTIILAMLTAPWIAGPAASRTPLEDRNLTTLPAPPFRHYLSAPDRETAIHPLTLKPVSAKPNRITDGDEWFGANGLALPAYEVPNPFQNKPGNLPEFVPEKFGDQLLIKAIRCQDAVLLVYGADFSDGRYLIALDPASGEFLYGFDFIHYLRSPKSRERDQAFVDQAIKWAWQENRVLYVSHAHSTYASASGGSNAYITALDTATGAVLWRSQPLVANAANFELAGDTLIAGYGFTAEPDYLYLLDKKTGAVYERIKLKSGPEYILLKGDQLYVRTYDTDYRFRVGR